MFPEVSGWDIVVNRHTGGLEMFPEVSGWDIVVNRHTGGLEISAPQSQA